MQRYLDTRRKLERLDLHMSHHLVVCYSIVRQNIHHQNKQYKREPLHHSFLENP